MERLYLLLLTTAGMVVANNDCASRNMDYCVSCTSSVGCYVRNPHTTSQMSKHYDYGRFKIHGCLSYVERYDEFECLPKFAANFSGESASVDAPIYEMAYEACVKTVPATDKHIRFVTIGSDGSRTKYGRYVLTHNGNSFRCEDDPEGADSSSLSMNGGSVACDIDKAGSRIVSHSGHADADHTGSPSTESVERRSTDAEINNGTLDGVTGEPAAAADDMMVSVGRDGRTRYVHKTTASPSTRRPVTSSGFGAVRDDFRTVNASMPDSALDSTTMSPSSGTDLTAEPGAAEIGMGTGLGGSSGEVGDADVMNAGTGTGMGLTTGAGADSGDGDSGMMGLRSGAGDLDGTGTGLRSGSGAAMGLNGGGSDDLNAGTGTGMTSGAGGDAGGLMNSRYGTGRKGDDDSTGAGGFGYGTDERSKMGLDSGDIGLGLSRDDAGAYGPMVRDAGVYGTMLRDAGAYGVAMNGSTSGGGSNSSDPWGRHNRHGSSRFGGSYRTAASPYYAGDSSGGTYGSDAGETSSYGGTGSTYGSGSGSSYGSGGGGGGGYGYGIGSGSRPHYHSGHGWSASADGDRSLDTWMRTKRSASSEDPIVEDIVIEPMNEKTSKRIRRCVDGKCDESTPPIDPAVAAGTDGGSTASTMESSDNTTAIPAVPSPTAVSLNETQIPPPMIDDEKVSAPETNVNDKASSMTVDDTLAENPIAVDDTLVENPQVSREEGPVE